MLPIYEIATKKCGRECPYFHFRLHISLVNVLSHLFLVSKQSLAYQPLSLNSERLSINECLSTVKEAIAADECSLGITASLWDRREITICIKHWRGTGAALIKTKLA